LRAIRFRVSVNGEADVEHVREHRPDLMVLDLSLQWSCPVLEARGFTPGAMAMVPPKIFVEEFGFVPLRVAGSKLLYLGFEDRLDATSALALEQMTELKVESGLVKTHEYREARQMLLDAEGLLLTVETLGEADGLAARVTAILEQKQPISSRFVRMHKYLWLRLWLEASSKKRAADPRRGRCTGLRLYDQALELMGGAKQKGQTLCLAFLSNLDLVLLLTRWHIACCLRGSAGKPGAR
jgi:hypothetical protein